MAWNKRFLAVAGAALLVAACESTPSKDEGANPSAVKLDASGKVTKLIPDPYLDHSGDGPAAAAQELGKIAASIKAGRLADAERNLLKLHETYPKLSGPLVNLGLVTWRQKKTAEAEAFFLRAQAANKYNSDAYTQYAVMLREQGKFKEAEAQYVKALGIWPHNFDAHRGLGVLYDLYMGKFDLALQHYQMCDQLSVEPNKEIKGWIVDLQRRTGKKAGE